MSKKRRPYGETRYEITEKQSLVLHDCPSDIEDRLRRAGFHRDGHKLKKYHRTYDSNSVQEDDSGNIIVSAYTVGGDELRVEAEDSIGVVSLIPGTKLQINPKVGWSSILRMFLTAQGTERTRKFYGIPLEDILSDDVGIEEVFFILTINYLRGMSRIHEEGFIRDLEVTYDKGYNGSGEVDMGRTSQSIAKGDPTPRWRRMRTDYDNVANSLLHFAGKRLMSMFQQEVEERDHPAYDRLFADLHQEVRHLEDLGVESSIRRIREYTTFGMEDLPRQRGYYQRAIRVSKAVLRSSLSGGGSEGSQELLMDYHLKMNLLFQRYSQALLEDELTNIRKIDKAGILEDVNVVPERNISPFENARGRHHPDHLILDRETEEAIAVLDSKYYQRGHNPVTESSSRSRMFAYAYLTGAEHLAFLCPFLRQSKRTVRQTGHELRVVSSDSQSVDDFSLDAYEENVRSYLRDILTQRYPELVILEAIFDYDGTRELSPEVSLYGTDDSDLNTMLDVDGPFGIKNKSEFADKVRKATVQSPKTPTRREWENQGRWLENFVVELCEKDEYPDHLTTCVPVLYPAENRSEGKLCLYYIIQDDEDPGERTVNMEPLSITEKVG